MKRHSSTLTYSDSRGSTVACRDCPWFATMPGPLDVSDLDDKEGRTPRRILNLAADRHQRAATSQEQTG